MDARDNLARVIPADYTKWEYDNAVASIIDTNHLSWNKSTTSQLNYGNTKTYKYFFFN